MLLSGYGTSGDFHDFFAFNLTGQVWKVSTSTWVSWVDADFTLYRIPATEVGTSERFTANGPTGTVRYVMRFREATLEASQPVWESPVDSSLIYGGAGDKVITVTVNDGTDPLANARITAWSNDVIAAISAPTDIDGETTLNLANGTYYIAISLSGHTFPGATLTVTANASVTYSMSQAFTVINEAEPPFCTLAIRVWGTNGEVAVGVAVKVQVVKAPDGVGEIYYDDVITDSTGADGYATFTVPIGCDVKYWIGNVEKSLDNVTPGEDGVAYVKNWLGHDA